MSTDVILIVALDQCDAERQTSFARAMSRRGWWRLEDAESGFRIGFSNAADDRQIVRICERDVRESAYVAGVGDVDATCLLSPDEPAD